MSLTNLHDSLYEYLCFSFIIFICHTTVMTNLDVAIGNLDEMSLPTEEEMAEFVNNMKRQTEWEAQNQETQRTVDNMQKYITVFHL